MRVYINSNYNMPFWYFEVCCILIIFLLRPSSLLLLIALGAISFNLICSFRNWDLFYVFVSIRVKTDFTELTCPKLNHNTLEVSPWFVHSSPNLYQLESLSVVISYNIFKIFWYFWLRLSWFFNLFWCSVRVK